MLNCHKVSRVLYFAFFSMFYVFFVIFLGTAKYKEMQWGRKKLGTVNKVEPMPLHNLDQILYDTPTKNS